ncbi:tRNA (adenosine(37)-N6)-threonylcarbamoyltransferase complex ATPase subunit type 1 TsaE [Chitinispirillales bacterium ANBcel5]|uniref:tRNA (adenosine(37)-N6)-threonylcarbamoyltransferase complex ATPase subunit type 1 TsaE n=1 Tax=Cellulosispirillum alkaliphilum TaxID=3039283 RepID=UPI002A58328D|nr:tRNA (adenosine(37)-N6)-threonylcarbamoyltransferase complex ATPase subunit type 1 TsaE [Chitinispirillales bacterium ANBcel5]
MILLTKSIIETRAIGEKLALYATPGDVFSLEGDLGCGKTELVRGFVHALSPDAYVRSPTFSIVNTYETSKLPVYHFDFYRLADPFELDTIGFMEYVDSEGVCLIEWGNMFKDSLPCEAKTIRIEESGENERILKSDFDFNLENVS